MRDVQKAIVDIAGDDSGYAPRLRRAIDGARAANIPVIYVVIALRPGFPEVGTRNRALTAIARAAFTSKAPRAPRSIPRSRPGPGDMVVTKRDTDPGVHRVLIECLFPQWADVAMVDDWLKTIAPQ
ncbi:hypothetical protein ACIQB5_49725 [Streptomyces sp. NPDC088560]|uniref:hypothetical protein n=1 Tax=Streptomyces sp. NPDC088560 TaxID=3365868 RepID=UPI0037F928BA